MLGPPKCAFSHFVRKFVSITCLRPRPFYDLLCPCFFKTWKPCTHLKKMNFLTWYAMFTNLPSERAVEPEMPRACRDSPTLYVREYVPNKQSGRQVHALAHVPTHETLRLWHCVTTRRLTGIGEEHGKAQRQQSRWRPPRPPTPTHCSRVWREPRVVESDNLIIELDLRLHLLSSKPRITNA